MENVSVLHVMSQPTLKNRGGRLRGAPTEGARPPASGLHAPCPTPTDNIEVLKNPRRRRLSRIGQKAREHLSKSAALDNIRRMADGDCVLRVGPTGKKSWVYPTRDEQNKASFWIAERLVPLLTAAELSGPGGKPLLAPLIDGENDTAELARRVLFLTRSAAHERGEEIPAETGVGAPSSGPVADLRDGTDNVPILKSPEPPVLVPPEVGGCVRFRNLKMKIWNTGPDRPELTADMFELRNDREEFLSRGSWLHILAQVRRKSGDTDPEFQIENPKGES